MTVLDIAPIEADDSQIDFVSNSSLDLHRKCPQAFTYKYLRHLSEIEGGVRVELELGTWWHALRALDAIARGQAIGSLRSAPKTIQTPDGAPDLVRTDNGGNSGWVYTLEHDREQVIRPYEGFFELVQAWWQRLGGETQDAWTEKLGKHPAQHLAEMDGRWSDRWAEDTQYEEPVAVEYKFRRQLPNVPTVLGGYVDEILIDRKRGLVIVRDDKTANTIKGDSEDDLMDGQLHLYAWAVTPQVKAWLDRGVNAIAYDRVRAKPPTTPVVTQSGTLSKTVSDYDLTTYQAWALSGPKYPGRKKDGSQAGTYEIEQAVIEKLSLPAMRDIWTQRSLTPLNRNIIRNHLQSAVDTQRAAEQTAARVAQTGEAARNLTRMGCAYCSFQKLCRAEMIGGPSDDWPFDEFGLQKQVTHR